MKSCECNLVIRSPFLCQDRGFELIQSLDLQVNRKDTDVELTLRTVESSFQDARLSWQDVSSGLLSFTAQNAFRKQEEAVDVLFPEGGEIKYDATLISAIQASTVKSKASLARISELALESLRQIGDGVKERQDLQRQLASLDKCRSDQQQLEDDLARMRADSEARMRGLKNDNAALSSRLAEADREV